MYSNSRDIGVSSAAYGNGIRNGKRAVWKDPSYHAPVRYWCCCASVSNKHPEN
jgi:hypothetical protein